MRRKGRRENGGKLKSLDLEVGCEMDRQSVTQEGEQVGPPRMLGMKGKGRRSIKIPSVSHWGVGSEKGNTSSGGKSEL